MGESPPHPRAWLFRVASNLWIDRVRRLRREELVTDVRETSAANVDPQSAREAAGTLLGVLSPQERAAVALKDVLDLSLEETAEALSTTVGAVKAALHRARGNLIEPKEKERVLPAPEVLNTFCEAFNAGDIDRLTALLTGNASVDVIGATTQYGPEAAKKTVLWGMLFGVKHMVNPEAHGGIEANAFEGILPTAPRVEARAHRGEWVLLHWYAHRDGEAVRALTRFHPLGDRIAHLQNYFYNPELITEVCGEHAVASRTNGRRWWRPST
jgi:RNA polymerase sigma-70 factor (ECF subfamily)